MARLFADENFPLPVVESMRRLGHDVLTAFEAGRADQEIPDEDVLSFARADGRAVLTLNRKHFIHLHAIRTDHSGIIVCTFDPDWDRQAGRIDEALSRFPTVACCLIRVNRPPR